MLHCSSLYSAASADWMSVPIELCSHWMDFHEILYLSIFRKSIEKILVSLKSDKNNGYFTSRPIYIFDHISLNSSFQTKVVEKIKTHFVLNNFFFSENCAVYEIMWKNIGALGRPKTIPRGLQIHFQIAFPM
jgi:hypothetical protein